MSERGGVQIVYARLSVLFATLVYVGIDEVVIFFGQQWLRQVGFSFFYLLLLT